MSNDEKRVWGIHTTDDSLFLHNNIIAIGWKEFGDCSSIEPTREAFKDHYCKAYPNVKKGAIATSAGMLYRFTHEMKVGDYVVFPSKADMYFDDCYFLSPYSKNYFFQQISMVIESIGYMYAQDDGITIFVPKVPAAIAVAESNSIPEKLSYELIAYNHHSKKGDLEGKRSLLLALGDLLEPRRKEINKIDSTFCTDLFYLFNNLNIRHNNTAPAPNPKYKQVVASMNKEELEKWYDETYQMCLLAFLRLDHQERKVRFDTLKLSIENNNSAN